MKNYRLKKWYPSLPNGVEVGHIIEFDGKANSSKYGVIELYSLQEEPKMWISSKELHPDFWELIEEKELLFITEDGIKITEHRTAIILVDADFMKQYKPAIDCNINTVVATTKLFFHESNADEYIWRNMRVFSYEDFIKYGNVPYQRVIEQLAKARIEQ